MDVRQALQYLGIDEPEAAIVGGDDEVELHHQPEPGADAHSRY